MHPVARSARAVALLAVALGVALGACSPAAATLPPASAAATPAASASAPAAGASADAPGASAAALQLAGTSWLLVGYVSPTGTHFTVPMAVTPTLVFGPTTVDGNAGCNTFNGTWTLDGEVLALAKVGWTEIACPEPGATVEKAYLANLALVDRASRNGDNLVLRQADGFAALEFVPAGS